MLIDFIIKKKIDNPNNILDIKTRNQFGVLAAIIGVITNFILIVTKLSIGLIINSVSVIANAIDSLSDFSSNIITLLGFHLSKKPADKEHPFGHQRIEYVSGLIVSLLILLIGVSILVTSVKKLINYEVFSISSQLFIVTIVILILTIIIKLYQFYIYNKLAKMIKSANLHDNAVDALTDIIGALFLIIGLSINYVLMINSIDPKFSIDGTLGILESILIIVSGLKLVKEEADFIIGKPQDKEFVKKIDDYVKSFDKVIGTHDVICHMYGPEMCYMTMHVEVDENSNFKEIDLYTEDIEDKVFEKFHVYLTIHMDPASINDPRIKEYNELLDVSIGEISNELSYHDLRVINHKRLTILVFDLLVPYKFKMTNKEILEALNKKINNKRIKIEVKFDHGYEE